MAVVSFQRKPRSCLIEPLGLKDEIYLVERRLGGKLINHRHTERKVIRLLHHVALRGHVEQNLAVTLKADKIGVRHRYDGAGIMRPGLYHSVDIKLRRSVRFQVDAYTSFGYELLSALYSLRAHACQHFQTLFRVADKSAESHSYRQAYHPCAGNANAHCVFKHITAQTRVDSLRFAAQQVSCLSHGKSHGHRLCTAHCRHHFFLD